MTENRFRTVLTRQAIAQIIEQADYYRLKSGPELADRWRRAVRDAARSLQIMPERQALFHFKTPANTDLRRLLIDGFPSHSLFYRVENNTAVVDILYMLHGARDIEGFFSSLK